MNNIIYCKDCMYSVPNNPIDNFKLYCMLHKETTSVIRGCVYGKLIPNINEAHEERI